MAGLLQDLRYALRRLANAPGFTAVAALTLALGMGANAAIFAVADAVVLAPLPYSDPQRRVMVWSRWKRFAKTWVNPAEMFAYAERCPSLAQVAFWQTAPVNLTGAGDAVRAGAGQVSWSTFDVLGVRPALGRGFKPEEDRPEAGRVVVISHELWQGRYAGDPAILGRRVELDGVAHEVVGVMPRGFALPTDFGEDAADPSLLWVPRAPEAEELTEFGGHGDFGAARLAPGASVAQANAELRAAVAQLTAEGMIEREMEFQAFAVSLPDEILGEHRPVVLLLSGAVGFLMLIACANVANLLLARAEGRQREIALRSALGASRRRLLRQLLIEGFVLAMIAAAASLALARGGLALLQASGPLRVPRAAAAVIDARTASFALALSVAVTLLFALAPALHSLRLDLSGALKQGGRAHGSTTRRRWRAALIVAETAFAVLLAVGAGLMARSLHNLGRVPLGFRPEGVLTAQVTLPPALYATPQQVTAFYDRLLGEVRALPGVQQAGLLRRLPLGQAIGDWGLAIEGAPPDEPAQGDWQVASADALEAMGLSLLAGRQLAAGDVEQAPQVAVVNQTMARRYWPGRDPIGRRFRMGSRERPWISVVGVVGDVRHHGVAGVVKPMFFRPHAQFHLSSGNPPRNMNLIVKAAARDPGALGVPLQDLLRRLDPRIPLAELRTLDDVVAASVATPRFAGALLGLFAGLALALAAVGVFGVLSYAVNERTPELGVRLALGAQAGQLRRLVLAEAAALVGGGVACGLLLALALTRVMRGLLHEVAPLDPLTFAGVALLLAGVGLGAAWLPAWRASRVDPLLALRYE